ncbi:hypothetical protein SPMU_28340 [Sphingomonas mucosissima]|uniref:HNH domain-containing protein n=2 Tax=Sphingomonas mucosissima TaxID=370959 RepID=A0A245ZFR8_9SPHN|nr:hypothetical protein SPMU_28340 [Sphingomonas mucosissima]
MGRVKRKIAVAEAEARMAAPPPVACALCGRPLGTRTEWHHVVPKSKGGTQTMPVNPICHRAIHVAADNTTLARLADMEAVRALPALAPFLRWIANKPADFNAPTRRAR